MNQKKRPPSTSVILVSVDPAVAMTVARAIREMMTKTNNPDKVIRCDNESGVSYSRGDGCDPACVVAFDCLLNE